jgi:hypothetical protein
MATRVVEVAVPTAEAVSMVEAVPVVVGAGKLHHQLERSRPTAFAVGRGVLGGSRGQRFHDVGFSPARYN